jgi:hypothetical protein
MNSSFQPIDENEIKQKLIEIVLSSPRVIECIHQTNGVPMTFHIDEDKMKHYILEYNPKWIQQKKYYLIAERFWGIREKVRLYIDATGTEFFIE